MFRFQPRFYIYKYILDRTRYSFVFLHNTLRSCFGLGNLVVRATELYKIPGRMVATQQELECLLASNERWLGSHNISH
jgi:hypothetical protein